MKRSLLPLVPLLLLGCKAPQFMQAGQKNNVSVSYRWKHEAGHPSELLLKIVNAGDSARQLHMGLDLYYQGFTVEQFSADTCIPAGRTFNGRSNGIYFIPKQVTPEQAASADTKVELTEFTAETTDRCP
jgi:hypothetical protein